MNNFKIITKLLENITPKEKRLINMFLLKSKTTTIFTTLEWQNIISEQLELEGHSYFLASQFHPEFKSRPDVPSSGVGARRARTRSISL